MYVLCKNVLTPLEICVPPSHSLLRWFIVLWQCRGAGIPMCWVLGRQRRKLDPSGTSSCLLQPSLGTRWPCCWSPLKGCRFVLSLLFEHVLHLAQPQGVSLGGLDRVHPGSDCRGHGGCLCALILKSCWEKQCSRVHSPVSFQCCTHVWFWFEQVNDSRAH